MSRPFAAQQAHRDHVPVPALAVDVLAQQALALEAHLLVGADAELMVLAGVQPDAIEVQGLEAVLDREPGGLGAVAFPPFVALSDHDAEARMAIAPVDLLDAD